MCDYFSNFGNLINDIKSLFIDATYHNTTEQGNPFNYGTYSFGDIKTRMELRPNRIDFVFDEIDDDNVDFVKRHYDLIADLVKKNINRIAINYNFIVKELDGDKYTKVISSKLMKSNGDSQVTELTFRQNKILNVENYYLNDITVIQSTVSQNRNTLETFPSITFALDINTIPGFIRSSNIGDEQLFVLFKGMFNELKKQELELLNLDN